MADDASGDDGASRTLSWRLGALVAVFIVSILGCLTPILLLERERRGQGRLKGRRVMHLMKCFSGGVVVAVGYCHVLADAREALAQLSVYPWADVVALGGSLLTLLLGQAIHNVVGGRMQQQRREAQLPEGVEQKSAAQVEMPPQEETVRQDEGGGSNGVEVKAEADMDEEGGREPPCPPHLSEAESMVYAFSGKEPLAMAYLLEIGIVFHSVLIGVGIGLLTHHVEEVRTMTIAVAVHQYFEGAGLSTCILEAQPPPRKRCIMFLVFSLTTSTGIAIGIATSSIYQEESRNAAIVQGFFNALAAGTLINLGMVDLLSEEFAKKDVVADLRLQRGMMLATVAGAAVMAFLAIYA